MAARRVLVIGGGGREHALVWKLASERSVGDIICAPGNEGIARLARCIPADTADPDALLAIAQYEQVDFTIVGPELPLSCGVADRFAAAGERLFGPVQQAARLESSKVFAKAFMQRWNVPTARHRSCDSAAEAIDTLKSGAFDFPVVLKADGLAAGKGVVISPTLEAAVAEVHSMMVDRRFGEAGARLVIEELLVGREASFFVVSDGARALPLGSAEDHKRVHDGDTGPNTGGMGAYAPSAEFDDRIERRVMAEVVEPVLEGMRHEGAEFRGFLFVGLMLTRDGPKVIEFNVRLGDPETQVIMPLLNDELSEVLMGAAAGRLEQSLLSLDREPHVGVVLAAGGYPDRYEPGKVISGLDAAEAMTGVNVFHSGTRRQGSDVLTAGGRVLTVVGSGSDYRSAIDSAYRAVGRISFDGMHYRKDIAAKAIT